MLARKHSVRFTLALLLVLLYLASSTGKVGRQSQSQQVKQKSGKGGGAAALAAAFQEHQAGRIEQSVPFYTKAIRRLKDPKRRAHAMYNLAAVYGQLGKPVLSVELFRSAANADPTYWEAYHNLGAAYERMEKLSEAESAFRAEVSIKPDSSSGLLALGRVLSGMGKGKESLKAMRQARKVAPSDVSILQGLGHVAFNEGKFDMSAKAYHAASLLRPLDGRMHMSAGKAFSDMGRRDKAIESLVKAVPLLPNDGSAALLLGYQYVELGQLEKDNKGIDKGIKYIHQSIRAGLNDHNLPVAYHYLGTLHMEAQRHDKAQAILLKGLEAINPDFEDSIAKLIQSRVVTCNWVNYSETGSKMADLTYKQLERGATPAVNAFYANIFPLPLDIPLKVARVWARREFDQVARINFSPPPLRSINNQDKSVRVAFLSSDLREHPMGHILTTLFGWFNRSRVSPLVFNTGPTQHDRITQAVAKQADKFVDVQELGHVETAQTIRNAKVDILVDLHGHTAGHRLSVMALRPALVQAHYLGFAGSVGADYIPVLYTDKTASPPDVRHRYSEHFVYMPGSYHFYDNASINLINLRAGSKDRRSLSNIPATAKFVWCGLQNPDRIEPSLFRLWMKLMKAVPDSVLWLRDYNSWVPKHLGNVAKKMGVDPSRLIFADKLAGKMNHVMRLQASDIFLDTGRFSAHSTAMDALRAGVPVVTEPGELFASRPPSSFLRTLEMSELVARTSSEYFHIARILSKSARLLTRIRERLAHAVETRPLFDTSKYMRALETSYRLLFELEYTVGSDKRFHVVICEQ